MPAKRNSTTRQQNRRAIRRTKPPCGICGEPIDYTLHYLDKRAFVIDHIQPLSKGGADSLANLQAAHRGCNRDKSDKVDYKHETEDEFRSFVTARTW